MACKTYQEMVKELKPFMDGKEDFENAVKAMRESRISDRVDAYEDAKLDVLDTLNRAEPYFNKVRVEFTDVRRVGDEYKVMYKYLNNDKEYPGKVKGEGPFTFGKDVGFRAIASDLDLLYSDKDFINNSKAGFEKEVVDLLNNPERMVELAEEINEMDEVKAPHAKELIKNLKTILAPLAKTIPQIAVHLNKQGAKNGGWMQYDGTNIEVYTSVGPDNRNKSALEVYVHELYHAVTKFAIESRDAKLSNVLAELRELKNQFLDEVTEEMLAQHMPDKVLGKEQAKAMLDYFAKEKVGLHEFVAYAMTNPAVMKELAKLKPRKGTEVHQDFASKMVAIVRKILERLTSIVGIAPKDVDGYSKMATLVDRLAQANNRQLEAKRNMVLERLLKMFSGVEEPLKKMMERASEKVQKMPMPKRGGTGAIKTTWYLARLAARAMVDEKAKRVLELTGGLYGLKPEGTIMTWIRDASESDATADAAERLGLISNNIEQVKTFKYQTTAIEIKKGFKEELSEAESTGLTDAVLDTDVEVLWGEYDVEKLLRDEREVEKEIRKLEKALADELDAKDSNYYRNHARLLGYSMATGTYHIVQKMNAESIYMKRDTVRPKDEVEWSVVEKIDKLATLHAIKETDKQAKEVVADLIKKDKNGVEKLVMYHRAHKVEAEEKLFSTPAERMKMMKGYTKEVYTDEVAYEVAPKSKWKEMKAIGYTIVEDVEIGKHSMDGNPTEMAMYKTTTNVRQNLHRVALRYTDAGRRGTSIRESYYAGGVPGGKDAAARDIAKIKKHVLDITAKMEAGEYEASKEDYGMAPVLNQAGEIVDFRYMMSKKNKISLLKMDRRAVNIMGRTYAATYDKSETLKYNEEVMKLIEEDAAQNAKEGNLIGKNNKEYARIEKDSTNEEIRDIWSVMPDTVKLKYPEGFVVRRDLMHSLLGYRELSIVNMPVFNQMPEMAKYALKVAEKVWKEIVKVAKVDIILRVPAVIIGNVTSNFMYSAMSGYSPLEIAKLQLQGVKDLNEMMAKMKEIVRLQGLIAAGRGDEKMERKVSALINDLESNPAKDLIDEGFYMTIIEELGLEDFTASNKFTEFMEDKLKGMPAIVRDGVNLLYLNERTTLFKTMNMATQYSDFVARYAQYHLMVRKGEDPQKAVKIVRDAFINYNKPNSRMVEWLNQMGFIMFTKYFTRIQKAIKQHAKDHPVKVLLAVLGQEFITGDIEDIYDQSLMVKDMTNMVYNPLDTLLRAITPTGAEAVAWAIKQGS